MILTRDAAARGQCFGFRREHETTCVPVRVSVVLAVPLVAQAQPARVHRLGWLSPAAALRGTSNLDALRDGLREVGYVEGRNITIEERWADDKSDRLASLASDLVRLRVDVICTAGSQAAVAAKHATKDVPIVFANVAFPDEQRLVASYSRPGGNVTGVAFIGPEYGKRLELLRQASPSLSRVALLYNPENGGSVLALKETQRWAGHSASGSSLTGYAAPMISPSRSPRSRRSCRTR